MGRPEELPSAVTNRPPDRGHDFARRRPFVWLAAGLAGGILVGKSYPLPRASLFIFLVALLPLLWRLRGRCFFLSFLTIGITGVGVLRIQQVSQFPANAILQYANGEWFSLEGRVVSLPECKQKGKRRICSFVLEADRIASHGDFFRVSGKTQIFLFNPLTTPFFADRVRIRGKLAQPRIPANPGGFDYRKYLAAQGIHTIFEGYGIHSLKILSRRLDLWSFPLVGIQKLRDACARNFDSTFPAPLNALLKALILGFRKDLPEEFREDFSKTGTTHLVAISGMNITLVAGSLFLLSIGFGLPQKAAAGVGLVAATGYVFLSGAGMPVVRAGWMAALFFTGLLLEREKDMVNSLFFALFMILIFDPKAIFQAGLQLSFLSVLSLALLVPRDESKWGGDWLETSVVLAGTFPLCIAYFNVFSWVSVLVNLFAIPLFHFGVLGGLASLFCWWVPFVGHMVVWATCLLLKAGVAWIGFWAEKSWGYFYIAPPSWKLILIYYLTLALATAVRKLKLTFRFLRPLTLSLWLAASTLLLLPRSQNHFSLTVLAAGPNELIHVGFLGGRHWLVNAGRLAPSNQARWIVGPFLRHRGVNRLEGILLTDFSRRHSGGLVTLLGNFSTQFLLFPGASPIPSEVNLALRKGARRASLLRDDKVSVGEKEGFLVLDVVEGRIFLLIYHEKKKFLLLPAWRPEILRRVLPRLRGLSCVDVLILPAAGRPPDENLWRQILSLLIPQWVVLAKRTPEVEAVIRSLETEEIPFFFLSETGALRFDIENGNWHIASFLSPPGN